MKPANKKQGGYSTGAALTGVSRASARRPGDFAQLAATSSADLAQKAGMAENCGFCVAPGALVAWRSSHGRANVERSQPVRLRGRQIAGFASGSGEAARQGGGLPPFDAAGCAMTVASERPSVSEIRAKARLNQCLNGRLGQNWTARANGSGPGAVSYRPANGVGGANSLLVTRENDRGGSNGRADQAFSGFPVHWGQRPFVERIRGSYDGGIAGVNRR